MAKIERKYLAHYINTSEPGVAISYERLGKDLEEYTPELKAKVEKKTDILGDHSVMISGYEKVGKVNCFFAEPGSNLFTRLQNIIDKGLVLDDLKAEVIEVKLWETPKNNQYPAIRDKVYIEVLNYGGDKNGYRIAFALHYTGQRTVGTFNPTEKTFTYSIA